LLFFSGRLSALEPAHTITQYAHTVWTRQNAQLPGAVLALAQTPDGNLWVGTEFGLLRFDSLRFLPWTAPPGQRLVSEYIYSLAADRDGSLWIGTREGLSHWSGERLQYYQTSQGPAGPGVAAILVDRGGSVWVGTAGYRSGGLCRVEANRLHCYSGGDGLPGFGVLSLLEDRSGNLWAGGLGLYRWKPGESHVYPVTNVPQITSIVEDHHGEIWTSARGVEHLTDGKLVPYRLLDASQNIQPGTLLSDRDGGLWVGTQGQGLLHLYEGRLDRFTHADGLSGDVVRSLFEDREGNVWAATDGGLDQFRDFPVTTISKREGLSHDSVGSVFASHDGSVWIGTERGLNRVQGGKIISYDKRDGLPSHGIMAIFEQQVGRVWVHSLAGLAYSERDRFHQLDGYPVRDIRSIAAMTEDRDHCVWLSDPEHGLIQLRDTHITKVVPWSQFENKQAWALEADHNDGGLWLGFAQGGIAYYKPGRAPRWYFTADGLTTGAVTDLHLNGDGTLWIATQGGLSRLTKGHIAALTGANGLPCDRIHAMVEDDGGALWLNTACGLVRVDPSELSAWSANPHRKIQVKTYDASDGMRTRPTPTGYFRRAAKSNDGRLWFAVLDGVAVVDPRHLPENRLPPPVQIEQITAGHTAYLIHSHPELPPLTRELQIDYSALSFAAPEKVRFRYRLEGFDKEWMDAGGRRQAAYTNLPPRHYQFRVIASNNDGVWNETGASVDFSIQPAFYQTNWFRLASIAGFTLLLWGLHGLRLRRMAAQLNVRFEERLAERTRIAREIHDTLLQNISGFALQLDGLSKTVRAPVRDRLHELRQQAEQCLREAREFVWDLRSPVLEEKDLSAALRGAGEEIVAGVPVRFHMTVRGDCRPAPAKLQEQLLRIVQEATRNSVRHGQATEINMHVAYMDPDLIRVQMRDDGQGFDLEEASGKLGHWGLTIMRERARQIGAELKISTAPGHGTEIEIVVPVASAS
jgi:signal transduction histidine kinase/ligand-binding sensor domain-containing protein